MKNEPTKPVFIPGIKLAEGFYREAVKPVLDADFPGLSYSAALIGHGSEVLGFDTEMSADHQWGPRVMLFLAQEDLSKQKDNIYTVLSQKLRKFYLGYSTNFSEPDPDDNDVQLLKPLDEGSVNHRVETFTISGFFRDYLGIDIENELDIADWLTLPQQKLRSITAGKIFYDGLGLEKVKQRFTWYPRDAWLFILASLWQRIGQEEHLTGRAGTVGDEIGSSIIASRIVRDMMRMALLMEKQYPPYAKWLGTAFYKLKCAHRLEPLFENILKAGHWQKRDKYLGETYEVLVEMHNALGITAPLSTKVKKFWDRPFTVISGERFKTAILEEIQDPYITAVLKRSPIGSIDIFSDNTDLLEDPAFRKVIRHIYE